MGSYKRDSSGRRWGAARAAVLRASPVCQVCGQRRATEVDHVQPLVLGGDHSPDNLRAVCTPCHRRLTAALADLRAKGPRARIVRSW